ncbi:hypothetical protein [Fulvivirga ligni]|uniref:hypothetical protein n=1 Tax=Fulvivirga ligni TaxID=2904246 RepID=UPI001F37DB5A|nr:hypothetical protein [Fulvivirga ligni]UII20966.1 hypothetical protein LVD16_24280 [Fulvivirga ligni]
MSKVEQIDAYFGNEMTDAEMLNFENSVHNDPSLKKEFEFQQEIVNSLREARKAELKAMLNAVPVSGGMSTGSSLSLGKVVSMVAAVAILGTSVYFIADSDKGVQQEKAITPTIKQEPVLEPAKEVATSSIEEESNTDLSEGAAADMIAEETTTTTQEPSAPLRETETVAAKANEANETNTNKVTASESKPVVVTKPNFNKPDVSSFGTVPDKRDSLEAPGGNLAGNRYKEQKGVEVEVENGSRKYDFHYQFKDGKLFLYGDFDHNLYEILEINANSDKSLFLFYQSKYYSLDKSQAKTTSLEALTDSKLINRLDSIRSQD